jgi:hypothetical protein
MSGEGASTRAGRFVSLRAGAGSTAGTILSLASKAPSPLAPTP